MNPAMFQNMGGAGPAAGPNQMQLQKSQMQIHQHILGTLRSQHVPMGWQTSMPPEERATPILSL